MNEKVNILIVDDLRENHLVMESVLMSENIDLISAMSGEEALQLCMVHDFALILMDVQMPLMDGFETAELLRRIEKTKKIPIIFVTAISKEKKSIFKGYEVGAVDYLFKPIDPMILKSKVNIFIELHRQRIMLEDIAEKLKEKIDELTLMYDEKQKLSDMTEEDFLTKIYNRRGLEKLMNKHWNSCKGYRLPFTIIMIDIDNFKTYNDNYGHLQGDEVLKSLSSKLKNVLKRPEDFIGRYGGEEFLIGLPNTELEGAITIANKINRALKDICLKHEYNGDIGYITVSMGLGTMIPSDDYQVQDLIKISDDLLYEVKKSGKNFFKFKSIDAKIVRNI